MELPDHPGHYRNWPRYHAPTVLRRWIQDVLDLKLVPGIHNYWWNDPSVSR